MQVHAELEEASEVGVQVHALVTCLTSRSFRNGIFTIIRRVVHSYAHASTGDHVRVLHGPRFVRPGSLTCTPSAGGPAGHFSIARLLLLLLLLPLVSF